MTSFAHVIFGSAKGTFTKEWMFGKKILIFILEKFSCSAGTFVFDPIMFLSTSTKCTTCIQTYVGALRHFFTNTVVYH